MKKIQLNVEALAVESFPTQPKLEDTRGTVEGHATFGCGSVACATALYRTAPCDTCQVVSCVGTCTAPYQTQC